MTDRPTLPQLERCLLDAFRQQGAGMEDQGGSKFARCYSDDIDADGNTVLVIINVTRMAIDVERSLS